MSLTLLCIQIHSGRAPDLDLPLVRRECEALFASEDVVEEFWSQEGDEDGRYINLNFESENRLDLWRLLKTRLFRNADFGQSLAASSIAVCTGDDAWNDYLLLHHFDPAAPLDLLAES
jgi:hypothetical protein